MEGEPPSISIVLVDLVTERVVLWQQGPFEKLFIRKGERREASAFASPLDDSPRSFIACDRTIKAVRQMCVTAAESRTPFPAG
jgi:hypothetical protein